MVRIGSGWFGLVRAPGGSLRLNAGLSSGTIGHVTSKGEPFFKPAVDATGVHLYLLRQSLVIAGLFIVPSVAVIVYWATTSWPNIFKNVVFAIPFCAILAGLWGIWERWKIWRRRPIARTNAIEDGMLVQREIAFGGGEKVVRETRVPLSSQSVALCRQGSIMLRSTGGESLRLVSLPSEDFLDEAARESFLNLLAESGVQFTDAVTPILFGPKAKSLTKK